MNTNDIIFYSCIVLFIFINLYPKSKEMSKGVFKEGFDYKYLKNGDNQLNLLQNKLENTTTDETTYLIISTFSDISFNTLMNNAGISLLQNSSGSYYIYSDSSISTTTIEPTLNNINTISYVYFRENGTDANNNKLYSLNTSKFDSVSLLPITMLVFSIENNTFKWAEPSSSIQPVKFNTSQ
jgi:hypothetical protein